MGTKFQRKTTNQATQVYIGYNVIETKSENSGRVKMNPNWNQLTVKPTMDLHLPEKHVEEPTG
jgi:hypothetical protein